MRRHITALLFAFAVILSAFARTDQTEVVKGIEVGQSMPLHVVHFVGGARESGKGCPTVMISNQRIRGLEIWAPAPSDEAFALAGKMDKVLDPDQKNQAFMILGAKEDAQEVRDLAQKHPLNKTTVCVPNSNKLFQNAKFSDESNLYVFFMDRKLIKSKHKLKASALTAQARQDLVEQFRGFLSSPD